MSLPRLAVRRFSRRYRAKLRSSSFVGVREDRCIKCSKKSFIAWWFLEVPRSATVEPRIVNHRCVFIRCTITNEVVETWEIGKSCVVYGDKLAEKSTRGGRKP
jgi:hypothetical protein